MNRPRQGDAQLTVLSVSEALSLGRSGQEVNPGPSADIYYPANSSIISTIIVIESVLALSSIALI